MSRNIELKARCADLAAAGRVAEDLGAARHGRERQHDTYFPAADGRLKLRQRWIDGRPLPSELIWYRRADEARPRPSDYMLVAIENGPALRAALAGALGVATEVVKERTVYLHDNVRVHLDEVSDLGTFVEFEAIVDAGCDDAAALAKLDRLCAAFAIGADAIVRGSYGDLVRAVD
jgi:adenylate cyclase class 2